MANTSFAKLRKLQAEAHALLEEHTLPAADDSELTRVRRVVLFCARVYHSFMRNRCPVRAAALAYTNLLALVPLLAVAISVSASFIKSQGEQSIQDWVKEAIVQAAPMLGLKEAASEGRIFFAPENIRGGVGDFDRLISRLQGKEELSQYLWDTRFTPLSKSVITNESLALEKRKAALTHELNKVVQGDSIYQEPYKRYISTKATAELARRNPKEGPQVARLNQGLLSEAYPTLGEDVLDTVTSQITGFVSNFQSGKLGVTAVLALIFVAISLLATIETTLNDIWGVSRGRGWFARIVQYWAALTLGPMLLFSALTVTTWAKVSEHVQQLPLGQIFMTFVVPLVLLSIACALLYVAMPNTKVPWQAALLGGVVAGALLQLNSLFNVMYLSRVLTYKQIYGSMAALPLFLIGLYFSWLLVLLGAQVAYAFQNRQVYVQERKAETINERGREFLAIRLMTHIGQQFYLGQKPPSAATMAEQFRIPLRLVGQILALLGQSGLVIEVAGADIAYSPARPLHQMTIRDILQSMRVGQGQDITTCNDPVLPLVQKEFASIEHAWETAATARSLEDLVRRVSAVSEPALAPG